MSIWIASATVYVAGCETEPCLIGQYAAYETAVDELLEWVADRSGNLVGGWVVVSFGRTAQAKLPMGVAYLEVCTVEDTECG